MPIIRIKSKGLPRAQYQNSQVGIGLNNPPGGTMTGITAPATNPYLWGNTEPLEGNPKIVNPNPPGIVMDPKQTGTLQEQIEGSQNAIAPSKKNRFGKFMKNALPWTGVGLNAIAAGVNYFEDKKKQKDWNKYFREQSLPDNMYATGPGGDRGDFDINQGIYRPNQLTPPNIGAASVAKYGGQLGFGLDIGQRRVYTNMPKTKDEQVSQTLNAVPREKANIEAEKGETVYGDLDNDGALEHFNIGGKRHVNGGTPLNVPEGSFIFSDTKKMIIKDPAILEQFGMAPRKAGYTPAEIAKKYDVNKYKGIMEDPYSDSVRKSTAQIMIKTFEKKLALLAIIQESMKGFPQGIPEVAKKTIPQIAEQYSAQYGLEDTLEDEANEQEQVMEQGMTEPEEEMMGEEQDQMSEESMMEQGMPEARYGGSRLPRYQGATGPSTVYTTPTYDAGSFGSINPFFNTALSTTAAPVTAAPTAAIPPATPASIVKPGSTGSRTVIPYAGGSQPTPTGIANKYQRGTEYLQTWEKYIPGISKMNNAQAQTAIYDWTLKNDPDRVSGMWQQYGLTEKGKLNKNLVGLTDIDPKTGKPLYTFKNRNFTNQELQDLKEAYVDELFGVRQLDPFEPKESGVTGYKCLGRDANGQPQIQSSSYMNAQAMAAAGAVSSSTEAEKQCPETTITTTVPPGEIPPGKTPPERYGWMTPDIVNMAAASAVAPKKYLPYAAPIPYEGSRLSLEDWRAQAAARQAMYNKQAEVMGVYGPTTGQAASQSLAAGQQAEGLVGDIAGVTSRNVDRVNQFLQQERQRKDQFNVLGANRATELYKGNVVANQQYDNSMRNYLNNIAKTYGQGFKNQMELGMLNAVNPMFKVDPRSGRSYFTGRGYGTNKFSSSANNSLANFPTLKNKYMSLGMSEGLAERTALKQLS